MLKIICTAQYLKQVKSGDYQQDKREYLAEFFPVEIISCDEVIIQILAFGNNTITQMLKKRSYIIFVATAYPPKSN